MTSIALSWQPTRERQIHLAELLARVKKKAPSGPIYCLFRSLFTLASCSGSTSDNVSGHCRFDRQR